MLQKFQIQGVHYIVDDSLRKYVTKKIGGLDRYVARHGRPSAHAEVFLKEAKTAKRDRYSCEVVMRVPQETIRVNESALNMFAAVDIAEAKLKQQLKKYKDKRGTGKLHRRLFARLKSAEPQV